MKRILLTGMSGTGKSSVISELAARGYKAIDADSDEWSEWAPYVAIPDLPEANEPELEWIWRADRIRDLLMTEDAHVLFVSGCASNMSQFKNLPLDLLDCGPLAVNFLTDIFPVHRVHPTAALGGRLWRWLQKLPHGFARKPEYPSNSANGMPLRRQGFNLI